MDHSRDPLPDRGGCRVSCGCRQSHHRGRLLRAVRTSEGRPLSPSAPSASLPHVQPLVPPLDGIAEGEVNGSDWGARSLPSAPWLLAGGVGSRTAPPPPLGSEHRIYRALAGSVSRDAAPPLSTPAP